VFAASFCSMALEIAASRLLAPVLGVSLYSWTGIIGVVLLGIMAGNYAGGRIADHSPKVETLGTCLFLGGLFTLLILILFVLLSRSSAVDRLGLIGRIVTWTAALFLAPMYLLGTISPQATRLAVADWDHAGRVAGRIYAWSCAGAIAGTFATGWGGIPLLGGVRGVILVACLVLIALSAIIGRVWERRVELFFSAAIVGAALLVLGVRGLTSPYTLETNYYAIRVYDETDNDGEIMIDEQGRRTRKLALDHLTHSFLKGTVEERDGQEVFVADPSFMGYPHEQVQAEFARLAAERTGGRPKVLVIGGGGYTFPHWAEVQLPQSSIEVVEIDPGVTEVAHRELGLPRDTRVVSHHMDGRQFVQERAPRGHYELVVQDAVNDLSVPYHIMTKEYNDAVKRLLTPGGIYLLTVIDDFDDGLLMRAAVRTMRETFPHVHVLGSKDLWTPDESGKVGRRVYVIYGSDKPFDRDELAKAVDSQKAGPTQTTVMPDDQLQAYLDRLPAPVLTDAYAPVDNLISVVFRKRDE
jgi:spermidine synthase